MIFFQKVKVINHPSLFFNPDVVPQTVLQKHLGMFLGSKLNFSEHLKTVFQKTNKTIELLQTVHPRALLTKICKSFFRSHLDYGDMIYDQTFNLWFQQKIKGFSKEKL